MSELDMTDFAPTEPLVLETAPVEVVTQSVALEKANVRPAALTAAQQKANDFVDKIAELDPHSADFMTAIATIENLGNKEVRAATAISNRMLDRPMVEQKDGSPQIHVANSLGELRKTVDDLNPSYLTSSMKRFFREVPMLKRVQNWYGDKYEPAQKKIDAITKVLVNGQDELRKDNAAIITEADMLQKTLNMVGNYATVAGAIDQALEVKIAQVETTDAARADALRKDALFPVRQKQQDLMTLAMACAQGMLAMDLLRRNNTELIKGVERTLTTTMLVLRTSVTIAQAAGIQGVILGQVNAINQSTGNIMENNARMLQQNSEAIQRNAASATIDVDKLIGSYATMIQTMEATSKFQIEATETMKDSVGKLRAKLSEAKPYLEQTEGMRAVSASGQSNDNTLSLGY